MIARLIAYFSQNSTLIARFGLVGIITFALNYFLVWLFYGVAALDYRVAVSMAYVCAVVVHFLLNRAFTYRVHGSSILGHISKYTGLLIFNYSLTIIVTVCTVELYGLAPYWGVAFATMVSAVSSFIAMKYFVFCNWRIQ
ncbi:MAG: GtrA family protein [Syntrophorhabdus aromaticivorans]|uniref:GtrA family protein n=1 Tax=Syntrophorhabdus aromaticivorans TaxID=328301 RepID=A0A971M371_9BACT|nr:GtrA family protein [Syntrophorhabdus aromaticivorans]